MPRSWISSVQFSHLVMSHSLHPHGLQHSRLPCPSLSPGVCLNLYPLIQWCHPTISSSIALFSSCSQYFLASGSFSLSWLFVSGGQSLGGSASTSVLPMNIQDWFPLGWTRWISLSPRDSQVSSPTHGSKTSILQHSAFFIVQLSHPYMTTRKTIALTRWTLLAK